MTRRPRTSQSALRQRIYDRMADEWGMEYNLVLPRLLCHLLGREKVFGLREDMSETEIEICKKLLGEHGYAFYRALLVQKGDFHG